MPSNSCCLKFANVIICDDVREEKSNKFILIGVYSGDIVVAQVPATIAPQLYVEYFPKKTGYVSFIVRYLINDEQKEELRGTMHIPESKLSGVMVLPPVLLQNIPECELRIEISVGDDKPFVLTRKRVHLGEVVTSSPNAALLPSAQSPPSAPAS